MTLQKSHHMCMLKLIVLRVFSWRILKQSIEFIEINMAVRMQQLDALIRTNSLGKCFVVGYIHYNSIIIFLLVLKPLQYVSMCCIDFVQLLSFLIDSYQRSFTPGKMVSHIQDYVKYRRKSKEEKSLCLPNLKSKSCLS